jgi:hypothetical protein
MDIAILGPWILLAMGLALLASSIKLGFAQNMMKQMVLMVVTGTLLSGSSVWGLGFVRQYADFLNSTNLISSMLSSPGAESYGEALDAVAQGDLKPEYSEAIVALATQRPIDGMDEIVSERIEKAPDAGGKTALTNMQTSLQQTEQTADLVVDKILAEGKPALDKVTALPPAARFFANKRLLEESESQLKVLGIDPGILEPFKTRQAEPEDK